ncbi:MAG TPA: POTRA domain-containing protein, partial [Limnobacter sp.]|nr:POTRA domain-containing protein [Limnobacter sp.]
MTSTISAFAIAVALIFQAYSPQILAQTLEGRPAASPDLEQEPSFRLSGFQVEGPELLPRDRVQAILKGFTDRDITFADLRTATAAVEQLHAEAGFEVVRVVIPEQEIQPGQSLKLQIVDARLDVVTVAGNDHFSSEHIQSSLTVLRPGALVNTV